MRIPICLVAAASIAVIGCSGGTEPPGEVVLTVEYIADLYYRMTFTTEEDGIVTDQLWRGSTIEMFLFNGKSLVFEETHMTGSATRDGLIYRVVLAR